MNDDQKVREVEKYIDEYHKSSDFIKMFRSNRNQALFDILRVYESLSICGVIGGVSQEIFGLKNADRSIFEQVHNLQDAVNTAICWIYRECVDNETKLDFSICETETTDFLIKYADPYSVIVDGYISYTRKANTGHVEGNQVIFDATPIQMQSFLRDVGERLQYKENQSLALMEAFFSPDIQNSVSIFAATIHTEDGRLCYSIDSNLYNLSLQVGINQWRSCAEVPQEWTFEQFTLEEYRIFWVNLYALCMIHFIAKLKSVLPGISQEDALIVQKTKDFESCISHWSGLKKEKVATIIGYLKYDSSLKNIDIMYQPLIGVGDYILITPSLILASNPERNLIALIHKKQDKKYFSEVNGLETQMCTELKEIVPENTDICIGKHLRDDLPDVDFGIYDKLSNSIFIAEMKWLIAADSSKEVYERQKDINHGCEQIEQIMGYAFEDRKVFGKRIFEMEMADDPDLFCCVIVKHDLCSTNKHVPVISISKIKELFAKYDLSTVFNIIRNQEFYGKLPEKTELGHKEVEYAGYIFKIPALIVEKDFEVWEEDYD